MSPKKLRMTCQIAVFTLVILFFPTEVLSEKWG